MSLILFFASLVGADVDRLGADVWADREAAQARLRSYGWLAVPHLLRGANGTSPEIRQRCRELLVPWQRWNARLKAIAVLNSPQMPNEFEFWRDESLRRLVFRIAIANGCAFDQEWPGVGGLCPVESDLTPAEAWWLLVMFREQLGTHRGDTILEQIGFAIAERMAVKP